MELIRDDVPEAEIVLRWLQGEREKDGLHSWITAYMDAPMSVLSLVSDDATIDDAEENRIRGLLLGFRGYPNNPQFGLFQRWPHDAHWSLVSVTRDELLEFLYIAHDQRWADIAGGTRDPKEGARRLTTGEAREATAADFSIRPDSPLDSIIAVSDGTVVVLVEGHNRTTAVALYPDHSPDTFEVYLGRSLGFQRWPWWG